MTSSKSWSLWQKRSTTWHKRIVGEGSYCFQHQQGLLRRGLTLGSPPPSYNLPPTPLPINLSVVVLFQVNGSHVTLHPYESVQSGFSFGGEKWHSLYIKSLIYFLCIFRLVNILRHNISKLPFSHLLSLNISETRVLNGIIALKHTVCLALEAYKPRAHILISLTGKMLHHATHPSPRFPFRSQEREALGQGHLACCEWAHFHSDA